MPAVSSQRAGEDEEEEGEEGRVPPSRSELRLKSLMRDELLINVQKFATQVIQFAPGNLNHDD